MDTCDFKIGDKVIAKGHCGVIFAIDENAFVVKYYSYGDADWRYVKEYPRSLKLATECDLFIEKALRLHIIDQSGRHMAEKFFMKGCRFGN